MNELLDKAIAHITKQAMEINHPFAIMIEEHLTSICTTEKVANKLLDESKNLKEFCKKQEDEMREKARKGGTGLQGAGLPDAEFHRRAEYYYKITEKDKEQLYITGINKNDNKTETKNKKIINIMDLI